MALVRIENFITRSCKKKHAIKLKKKEGRNGFYVTFNRDETETWNRDEIPFSSRIVPRGLSVAEGA